MWFVYLIRTKKGIYTGVTTDMLRRFRQHRGDLPGGAKFFRGNKPVELVHLETYPSRSLAQKGNLKLKNYLRSKKKN